jgi:hypothetical protein
MEQFVPLPTKSEFESEGVSISATTSQLKHILRLCDCVMLHEHSLISPKLLQHNKGDTQDRIAI